MRNYSRNTKILILLAALVSVILISLLSYYTGDYSLEVAYALAILLPSWYAGRLQGLAVAAVAGAGIVLSYHYFNVEKTIPETLTLGIPVAGDIGPRNHAGVVVAPLGGLARFRMVVHRIAEG